MGGVAMSEQLSLFGDDRKPTGRGCPYWVMCLYREDGTHFRDICARGGNKTFTICSRGVFGEPPRCAYDEPDNSEAACSRRLEWMKDDAD